MRNSRANASDDVSTLITIAALICFGLVCYKIAPHLIKSAEAHDAPPCTEGPTVSR